MKRLIVVIFLLIPFLNTAQNLKPYKNEDGLWGFKDSLGFVIIKARFKKVEVFSEGLAAVLDVKKEKWTFVNTKDELIFEPRFKYTPKPFQEGLSIVVGDYTKSDLFYGVINTKGEIVIPPKYSKITGPYKSVYLLTNENKLKYNISDDTYGLALTSGKILSEPIFEDAMNQPDENGWISVKMNGERKYQNIDGRLSDIPIKKNTPVYLKVIIYFYLKKLLTWSPDIQL